MTDTKVELLKTLAHLPTGDYWQWTHTLEPNDKAGAVESAVASFMYRKGGNEPGLVYAYHDTTFDQWNVFVPIGSIWDQTYARVGFGVRDGTKLNTGELVGVE